MSALNAPGRQIVIDGKPAQVKFTTNRLIEVEERFGSLDAAAEAMSGAIGKGARYLLWLSTGSGATHTEEQFGELDVEGGLIPALGKAMEAFMEAMGTSVDDASPVDPTNRAAPTPSASS